MRRKRTPGSLLSRFFLLIALLIPLPAHGSQGKTLSICTDQNYWFPYSYAEQGESRGMHIDVVHTALTNLGYSVTFTPLPWKRCLYEAKNGQYDAIVSASYKPKRADFLWYPSDAATTARSKWRITQVEYTFIGLAEDPYEFTGQLDTLPSPVRAPLGYSVVDDLQQQGIAVFTEPDTKALVHHLLRTGKGVIVAPVQNALTLMTSPEFTGKIKVHKKPLVSKSYFLVFAKTKKGATLDNMQKIWNEIERIRETHHIMDHIREKYNLAGQSIAD